MNQQQPSYQRLLETVDDAFVYHEILFDEKGDPKDSIIYNVNQAFEKIAQLDRDSIIGKKMTEIFSAIKDTLHYWFATYGDRAIQGEIVTFKERLPGDLQSRLFATFFVDSKRLVTLITCRDEGFTDIFDSWGLVVMETTGAMIAANRALCHMLGYTIDELYSLKSSFSMAPSSICRWKQEEVGSKRIDIDGYKLSYIKELRKKDGSIIVAEITIFEVNYGQNSSYLFGIAQKANDLQKANRVAKKRLDTCCCSFELAPFGLILLNTFDGSICINSTFIEMFGYTEEDIPSIDDWCLLAFPEESVRDKVSDEWKRGIEEAKGHVIERALLEHSLTCKDGSIKEVEIFIKFNGPICRIALLDKTEGKKIERALKESEEKLNYFFSQSLEGSFFMMLDKPIEWGQSTNKERVLDYVFHNQRMTKVNQALLDQYRAKEEEFIGLTPYDLFKHNLQHGRYIWRGLLDKGQWHVVTDERRFDGTQMWVEGDYICMYDDQGRITGHFGVQADITERKEREKMLKESEERAKRQREAIANLVLDEAYILGEIPAAFRIITEVLSDTLAVERSSIWVLSEDGAKLKCLSLFLAKNRAHSQGEILYVDDFPHYFEAILKESRVYVENASDDHRTKNLSEHYLKPLGITSILDAGIVIEGNLIGVVCLEHVGEKRKWHADEEGFVSTIASMVAQVFINNERKQIQESLQFQLAFEEMVSTVSSFFVGLPSGRVDDGIQHALKRSAEFFAVDRSYLFLLSSDGETMSNTHEWCAEGISSEKEKNQRIPISMRPWWIKSLREQDHIFIPEVEMMPEEALLEKENFIAEGIRSLFCVPIFIKGALSGFFGFDSVKQRMTLKSEQKTLLIVIAELISTALIREEAEDTIHYLSFHDQLTGLYNRHYLEEEMNRFDQERQWPISIIMVDVNALKLVNDTYGHEKGDEMLKSAASILKSSCREEDSITRWGGDEFVVFLPKTSEKEAWIIRDRIESQCKEERVEFIPLSMALGVATKKDRCQDLYRVLQIAEERMYKNKLVEGKKARRAILENLIHALQRKSQETKRHTCRMKKVACSFVERMGLLPEENDKLELLISFHDIGNIVLSEDLLNKPQSLTEKEWELIKKHPEIGFRIARSVEEVSQVAPEILSHHEWWDGSGYPQGLDGEEIPLLARIFAIIDAYDVMTTGRSYRAPMSRSEAMKEVMQYAGRQFDPALARLFVGDSLTL